MGRILLLLLIILAIFLLWKAFGPSSWKRNKQAHNAPPAIKGPDDDEEFLWKIEKQRFKERREKELREQAQREQQERDARKRQLRGDDELPDDPDGPDTPPAHGGPQV